MTIPELEERSWKLRQDVLDIVVTGGTGHIGGDMSVLNCLLALYKNHLRITPETVDAPNRDRFVLSKGHAVEAYYAVLADCGFLDLEEVKARFSRFGSPYIGHPNNKLNGIEMNSGSLGHAYPWCTMPEGESKDTLRAEFMKREILNGNSALADGYCTWLDGKYYEGEDAQGQFGTNLEIAERWAATGRGEPKRYDFISEGDSPTFLPLFDWGFRTLEDFSYGGFAGRYHRVPGEVNAKGEP